MRTSLFIAGIVLLLTMWTSAAEVVNDNSHMGVARVEWQKLAGWVEARDLENRSLGLRDRYGNLAHIVVDDKVQIFRDWRLVGLNDIKVKDRVVVRRPHAGL